MLDRVFFEKLESDKLSPYAALSATSQGSPLLGAGARFPHRLSEGSRSHHSLYFSGDDAADETQAAPEPADEAVVEVTPLLPSRAITAASWRDEYNTDPRQAAAEAEAEEAESASLLDGVEFGDEGDKRRRYEKSVEKTVSGIQGLGVYVAPESDADKDGSKKKKKR